MNKSKTRQSAKREDIIPEYNLRGKKGVRGKYYKAYQQGHTVRIHEEDGSISTQYFSLADGAVMPEPDVREYFSNSDAVNKTLSSIIALIPENKKRKARMR